MSRITLIALVTMAITTLVAPQATLAGSPNTVDPALMQPPLNPTFAPWECWRAGNRIICAGSKTESYSGLVVDFLSCDSGPIYSTGTFTATARRIGDNEGRALKTAFRDRYVEYFSSDPSGENPRLRSIGRSQHEFEYGTPGDGSTVSETLSGLQISVTGAGVGVVFHDVGTLAFDADGNLIRYGGIHPGFDPDAWSEVHDAMCAAFEPGS